MNKMAEKDIIERKKILRSNLFDAIQKLQGLSCSSEIKILQQISASDITKENYDIIERKITSVISTLSGLKKEIEEVRELATSARGQLLYIR